MSPLENIDYETDFLPIEVDIENIPIHSGKVRGRFYNGKTVAIAKS